MIHHIQNLEGRLGDVSTTNTLEDDHINDLEKEANLKGTMTFRNWTDSLSESFYLDIPKFNQPKTTQQYLIETINEISLSKENAVDIDGDLAGGTFTVGDITYEYSIKNIPNPYKDLGLFYNVQFTPRGEVTSIPKGGKENYIKILSTMYKIIVDFIDKEQPDYIGISSLDNSRDKNYHTIYNRLTNNNLNLIPGYFRKDSSLQFDSPQGKGRFIVLKRKDLQEKKNKDPFGLNQYARELAQGLEEVLTYEPLNEEIDLDKYVEDWLGRGGVHDDNSINRVFVSKLKQLGYEDFGTIYRILYVKNAPKIPDLKKHIWTNYNGKYISFSKTLEGAKNFMDQLINDDLLEKGETFVIIKQKSPYYDLSGWVEDKIVEAGGPWAFATVKDYWTEGLYSETQKTQEVLAVLNNNFEIEGRYSK
jgi:hypothetical protein